MNLPPVVEVAHDHGAYLLVDDFHGTGVVPIDVHELGIDFLLDRRAQVAVRGSGHRISRPQA